MQVHAVSVKHMSNSCAYFGCNHEYVYCVHFYISLYSMANTYYICTSLIILCIIICRVMYDICNNAYLLNALFPERIVID